MQTAPGIFMCYFHSLQHVSSAACENDGLCLALGLTVGLEVDAVFIKFCQMLLWWMKDLFISVLSIL